MPKLKHPARSKVKPRPRRRRAARARRDIGHSRIPTARDIAAATSRPSHRLEPIIVRWPKGLLEAVDAEFERRKKKTPSWKRHWWQGPHSRASTIRELVAERLKVSDRDGSPLKSGAK